MLNAVINSIKAGKEEACDITLYAVEQCFDALWAQECINTLYECGLNNDKLGILYEETKHANIAIKTAMGITERVDIENLIMQGTVFGSIICTSVIEKLAKIFYQDKNLLYKYKGVVEVPIQMKISKLVLCCSQPLSTAPSQLHFPSSCTASSPPTAPGPSSRQLSTLYRLVISKKAYARTKFTSFTWISTRSSTSSMEKSSLLQPHPSSLRL